MNLKNLIPIIGLCSLQLGCESEIADGKVAVLREETVLHLNEVCNGKFSNCSGSEESCLREWDGCMQQIREQCAGVSGSFLENPSMDSDNDGAVDFEEAAVDYTSFCHEDLKPITCADLPIDDCEGYGATGQKNLVRSLIDFFSKK